MLSTAMTHVAAITAVNEMMNPTKRKAFAPARMKRAPGKSACKPLVPRQPGSYDPFCRSESDTAFTLWLHDRMDSVDKHDEKPKKRMSTKTRTSKSDKDANEHDFPYMRRPIVPATAMRCVAPLTWSETLASIMSHQATPNCQRSAMMLWSDSRRKTDGHRTR